MLNNTLLILLFVCVIIQIGYAVYYFIPFIRYQAPVLPNPNFPVSVIIAAHNEAENLKRLLPALLSQQYKNFEIVIVDDRSTDGTKKYLENLRQNSPGLRILRIEHTPSGFNPKKYAITQGITAARFEHLLFTDADCLPTSNSWIREMTAGFFAETSIVLGYSPYIAIYGFLNQLIRFETLVSGVQYLSFAHRGNSYMGVGRNLAYTKSCFNGVNGFNSHKQYLGGDDDLFVRDAGEKNKVNVVFTKESQTASIPKRTYQDWIIQKRRHLAVGRQYKWPDKLRIGIYMLANILFYLTIFSLLFTASGNYLIWVGILFSLRGVVIYLVYALIARKLSEHQSILLMPVLDLVYILNYIALGLSVLMFKKVKWK